MLQKMKDIGTIVILLLVLGSCFFDPGSIRQALTNQTPIPPVPLNFSMETGTATEGNMHYITLNVEGELHDHIGLVFQKIRQWEQSNDNLEIVDIDYDEKADTYGELPYVFGIIIRSRPKE